METAWEWVILAMIFLLGVHQFEIYMLALSLERIKKKRP